ncbi:uncharacterized protein PAC_04564 [Phialocephala subalpina]|uniref:Uncharacterized protein n=1 Tax=Phialocephala subalpina TaxID=576137 RepID=A0A1L7WPH9_9HELO|nr:uncharacterized protein PAC_04564 [Phialocephala subalpina]
MQFLAVAIASLSLGSQVLAAPFRGTATINGVTTELNNGHAVGTRESVVKRTLGGVESLPLVTPATTDAKSAVGGVFNHVSSVAKRSLVFTTVGSVSTLKSSVQSDLSTISSTVASDVTTSIVPTVHSSLVNIIGSLNGTVCTVVPGVVSIILPLAAGEVEAVISLVGEVESLISDIKSVLTTLVQSVESDVISLLAPEISAVLALVLPLVTPIAGFAYNVAGTVVGTESATELVSAAASMTGVACEVLSPVGVVLSSL